MYFCHVRPLLLCFFPVFADPVLHGMLSAAWAVDEPKDADTREDKGRNGFDVCGYM